MNPERPEIPLDCFRAVQRQPDDTPTSLAALADGLVGKDAMIDGPFGQKPMVYADYVASGRALMQVERFVLEQVLPYYANSHTEASYCGGFMTRLRSEARATIGACCGASQDHAVIFAGAGATAGINRLIALFGVGPGRDVPSSSARTSIIPTSCRGAKAAPR